MGARGVAAAAALVLAAGIGSATCAQPPRPAPAVSARPIGADVLFWSQAQRVEGFPHMEAHFPVHTIRRGVAVHPLPPGRPLTVVVQGDGGAEPLDRYMAEQFTAGLLVIQDGRIRLERYGLGYGPTGRWTSFSVAKSFTSTLVGAAIRDGYIKSLQDPVTRYIPELKGAAYDGVTVRQLLTMTSGVKWNEDYTDPKSDVAQLFTRTPPPGMDATVAYMRNLPREAEPGTKWVYKTGETGLVGVLVARATGRSLADYLSEKVWRPYGMEQDGIWMVDARGQEPGGCCLSAALHDYGRFGQFILDGGVAGGRPILPDGWLQAATRRQVGIGEPGRGYGFQWWTDDDGTFNAEGIYGQAIHIDPRRRLVVVVNSAWPAADPQPRWTRMDQLFRSAAAAVDAEAAGGR